MNRKLIAAAAAGCLTLGLGASAAAAGPPAGVPGKGVPAGIQCQQAGISTLQSLGILDDVARDGIQVVGGDRLPLRTVLELHRESPELFQTGTGVTVEVPGIGDVPATWCDPA
jgi:2-polyprenyl-6-methoxyphenol hydroxylase-like FAD-dependent oxidoreductase